ncbi:hypothetical protein FQA39_LY13325 [Lamprigera yunnana]|nr:hypothetical protein FQA39_LY13325 [Lamprigera yunnana]
MLPSENCDECCHGRDLIGFLIENCGANEIKDHQVQKLGTVQGNGAHPDKIGRSDTAECSCGAGNEDSDHIIRQCTKYNTESDELTDTANHSNGFNGLRHEE